MNPLYYDKAFQAEANAWWRTLSINEMKAYERQFQTIMGMALPSEIAKIYHHTQLGGGPVQAEAQDHSLDHVIYDGMAVYDQETRQVKGSVRP
jgi:hypothetical protein